LRRSWEPDGVVAQEIDYGATYEVDGDTVLVSHGVDYKPYRWSVDGDTLELEWLDTTYGGYQDIPEEVSNARSTRRGIRESGARTLTHCRGCRLPRLLSNTEAKKERAAARPTRPVGRTR
jgi:hypothetical protein